MIGARRSVSRKRTLRSAQATDRPRLQIHSRSQELSLLAKKSVRFSAEQPGTGQCLHGEPRVDAHLVDVGTDKPRFEFQDADPDRYPRAFTGHSKVSPDKSFGFNRGHDTPEHVFVKEHTKVFDQSFAECLVEDFERKYVEFSAFDDKAAPVGEPIKVRLFPKSLTSLKKDIERSAVRECKRFWVFDDPRAQKWKSRVLLGFDDALDVFVTIKIRAGTESGLVNRGTGAPSLMRSQSPGSEFSSSSSSSTPTKSPKKKATEKGYWVPRDLRDDDGNVIDATGAVYFPASNEVSMLLFKGAKKSGAAMQRLRDGCRIEIWVKNDAAFGAGRVAYVKAEVYEEKFKRRSPGQSKDAPRELLHCRLVQEHRTIEVNVKLMMTWPVHSGLATSVEEMRFSDGSSLSPTSQSNDRSQSVSLPIPMRVPVPMPKFSQYGYPSQGFFSMPSFAPPMMHSTFDAFPSQGSMLNNSAHKISLPLGSLPPLPMSHCATSMTSAMHIEESTQLRLSEPPLTDLMHRSFDGCSMIGDSFPHFDDDKSVLGTDFASTRRRL